MIKLEYQQIMLKYAVVNGKWSAFSQIKASIIGSNVCKKTLMTDFFHLNCSSLFTLASNPTEPFRQIYCQIVQF